MLYVYLINEYVHCKRQKNPSFQHIQIPYDIDLEEVKDEWSYSWVQIFDTHKFIKVWKKHISASKFNDIGIDTNDLDGKHIPPYDGPATIIICDWLSRIYKNYICDHIPLRQI